MRALLLDTETTGIGEQDRAIEIGAMVTSEDFGINFYDMNVLIKDAAYPKMTEELTKINGITQELLDSEGIAKEDAYQMLEEAAGSVDVIIAYNEEFDRTMLFKELKEDSRLRKLPWLCAMKDAETNYKYKCWKLSHLALDKGVPVNPKELHRAIADVELMRKMLHASSETISGMLAYNKEPWTVVSAEVPAPWTDGGEGVKACKELGFSWEKIPGGTLTYAKKWVKRLKAKDLDDLIIKSSFKVVTIR